MEDIPQILIAVFPSFLTFYLTINLNMTFGFGFFKTQGENNPHARSLLQINCTNHNMNENIKSTYCTYTKIGFNQFCMIL